MQDGFARIKAALLGLPPPPSQLFARLTSVSPSSHLHRRLRLVKRPCRSGGAVLPQIRQPMKHPSMTLQCLHLRPTELRRLHLRPAEHRYLHLRPSTASAVDQALPPTDRVCILTNLTSLICALFLQEYSSLCLLFLTQDRTPSLIEYLTLAQGVCI
jgi:hypothetical protein